MTRARAEDADIVLMDTAGRLQNRAELMGELEKIIRVMKKIDPEAPHAVLLVLDATVGQNALSQVEIFGRTAGVTGLVMTKLDGTARGGILVAIADKFALPVHFIGVGESVDDLEPFTARDFAEAIAGVERAGHDGALDDENARDRNRRPAAAQGAEPDRQVRARARAAGAVLHRLLEARHIRRDRRLMACVVATLVVSYAMLRRSPDHASGDGGHRRHLRLADTVFPQ